MDIFLRYFTGIHFSLIFSEFYSRLGRIFCVA